MWPEPVRKLPVALMRSALFAVVNGAPRKEYPEFISIVSTKDIKLSYKGEQLTQADQTVWMQDLHIARGQPLASTRIVYTPYAFLRSLGQSDGTANHVRLWESQRRLRSASLHIETKRYEYEGSLILEVMRERQDDYKGSRLPGYEMWR